MEAAICKQIVVVIIAMLTQSNALYTGSLNMSVNNCDPKDFQLLGPNGEFCALQCTSSMPKGQQAYSYGFYYYSTDPNVAVELPDFKVSGHSDTFTITLNLYDYNAGYYVCKLLKMDVNTKNITTISEKFKIDSKTYGSRLGAACEARQDCLALNAQCQDGLCQCTGTYYINYGDENTPACLQPVAVGGRCYTDRQCEEVNSQNYCISGFCRVTSKRLSGGEIAGIVIASLAFTLAIVALVVFMVTNRKTKHHSEKQTRSAN